MKNKITALVLLLVLSFALTACTIQDVTQRLQELPVIGKYFGGSDGGINVSEPVTITMWGLWENPEIVKKVISSYTNDNPKITVEYEDRSVLPSKDYKERVLARAGESLGADVVLVHNTWVQSLVNNGNLIAMPSRLMNASTFQSTYYPVAYTSGVSGGNVYAVPLYHEGLVLVYNKAHFAEVGQQEPPATWEEFRVLANKLTIRTGQEIVRSGAAIGNADNIQHFSDILGLMFVQTKAEIPQDLDTDRAVDAVKFYTSFATGNNPVWNGDMPEETTAFAQEKVSMILVPTWRILDLKKANPSLNIGVSVVPQARVSDPASWASFWMLVVPKSSANPEVAWNFINHLTSEEQALAMFSEASKEREFGTAFARVSLAPQQESHPYLGPLLKSAPYSFSAGIAARSGNDTTVQFMRTAINRILAGEDPATVLKLMKEARL
jgi:multiple sugar transport system substrate-binding protein